MKICHTYARHYNFGDHGLGIGVRSLFDEYFDDKINFWLKDIHNTVFDDDMIDWLNREMDLLLIGGGGLIHAFDGKWWMLKLSSENVHKIKIPIIIFGIGYNQFRGESPLPNPVVENLLLLQEKALSFSVRNDGSQDLLKKHYDLSFPEVADPGFFLKSVVKDIPTHSGRYVIFQLANDMVEGRNFNKNGLLHHLKEMARHLISNGFEVILCPHVEADIKLSEELIELVDGEIKMWNWYRMIKDEFVLEGLALYRDAEFVVSMRGHSQIFPFGFGIPFLSLGNHDKHKGLVEKLGVNDLYIDVNEENFCSKVIDMIDNIVQNREDRGCSYRKKVDAMYSDQKSFVFSLRELYDRSL